MTDTSFEFWPLFSSIHLEHADAKQKNHIQIATNFQLGRSFVCLNARSHARSPTREFDKIKNSDRNGWLILEQ